MAIRPAVRAALCAVSLGCLLLTPTPSRAWGFEAHRFIAEQVIARLPPGLRELFEARRASFIEHAIDPDLWRNVGFEEEPPRHFLDLDSYGAAPFDALPRSYDEAVTKFGPERVNREGTLPWRAAELHGRLRRSFEQLAQPDAPGYAFDNAIYFASVLGHYVGDAHVPFHAIKNYDGQLSNQHGVHSRFESELFSRLREDLTVAPDARTPVTDPRATAFEVLIESAGLTPRLLQADREAIGSGDLYDDGYFSRFAAGGAREVLERRVNESIAMTVAYITGAWEAAGKPDLSKPRAPRPPQRRRVVTP